MEERTRATTPIQLPWILFGAALIALAVWQFPELGPRDMLQGNWVFIVTQDHVLTLGAIFLVGLVLVLKGGTHYTIGPHGLVVRVFFLPIRVIRWSNIGNAEVLGTWISGEQTRKSGAVRKKTGRMYWDKGCGIFVTTRFCPGYVAEAEPMTQFCLRHPIGAMFLRFSRRYQQRYVDLFRKYYPKLEIQMEAEELLKS